MVGMSSRASNDHLYNMKYLIREQGKSGVKIKMEKNRGIVTHTGASGKISDMVTICHEPND